MVYTEAHYENAIIEIFRDTLGYRHAYGPDIDRDYSNPLFMDELFPALRRINPKLSEAALKEALYKLQNLENGTLIQKNAVFMDYLQNGISVTFYDGVQQRATLVRLVDYENINQNTFTVANQWTVIDNSQKRPDIVVFLNGFPIVVFELKSPSREETGASEGYLQLRNYMHEIPSLFTYNAVLERSEQAISMAGTITAG